MNNVETILDSLHVAIVFIIWKHSVVHSSGVDLRGVKGGSWLPLNSYLISKIQKVACTANEISLTADFQSLSLQHINFVPQKVPDSISKHAFFKKFLGGHVPRPLGGSYFAFWTLPHIDTSTSFWPPLYKSLDPPLIIS